MKQMSVFVLAAGLLFAIQPIANGRSTNSDTEQPPSSVTLSQNASQEQQPELKTFTGRISKSGEKFILEDTTKRVAYQLDDQAKAQRYQGKSVRVTGTLDAENNLIHVQSIEAAA